MAEVIIYTKESCPYCVAAKRLFDNKGTAYQEINLEDKPSEFQALKDKTGMRTVPQIFIDGELVGGYTELSTLDRQGKLDPMLAS